MIGGPKNLYNLFSLFPRDSYVILTSASAIDPQSAATGSWLPGKYVYFDRKGGDTIPGDESAAGERDRIPIRRRISVLIQRIPLFGIALLDALYLLLNLPKIMRSARKVIREDGITRLLGISDGGLALLGTYLTHKWSGLPYSLYLFDLYRGNNLTCFTHAVARILEPRLIQNAEVVIVTNETTGEYLRQRYGSSFRLEIVHNSAFPEDFEGLRTPPSGEPPFKILFTGNVYWAQEGAVLNMIRAMDLLRDLPVELDLYCPQVSAPVRSAGIGRPNVRLTSAPQSEMSRVQSEATLLFLPLAWGTDAPDIIATASPGKFTDYLASGKPILVHAPEYSYIARYTKEHDVGIVVDQDDVGVLAGAVREFLQEPACGSRYVENALKVFKTHYDARENAKMLWGFLGGSVETVFRENRDLRHPKSAER
jgi:glycosyltransferase involved in cell wall biosynthesis